MQPNSFYALPDPSQSLLLHTCCAPCSGDIMLQLKRSGVDYTLFFYNPNIHPIDEYRIRKEENLRYAKELDVPFIDVDYDVDHWFERVKGLEDAPERGERCTVCFDMRFERTALYGYEHGFGYISSTLGISRWKDMNQITNSGLRAADRYPGLEYWTINWRKHKGSSRMVELAKQEKFYQQEYCGCVFSLRDTNRWRASKGRGRIERGVLFYGMLEETTKDS